MAERWLGAQVTYSLLFWLPFYLSEGAGLPKGLAAIMATLNDIGMVVGGIVAGWWSDKLSHRDGQPIRSPIVVFGQLAAIVPIGLLTLSESTLAIGVWITLIGFFLGMPAECSTSAVCVDLAKTQPKAATATVLGIVDGTGALGAALGQQLVALVSDAYGWHSVFYILILSLLLSASFIIPTAIPDVRIVQANKGTLHADFGAGGDGEGVTKTADSYAPPVMETPPEDTL